VLSAVNFLNYIDRSVMSVVLEGVKDDFLLGDAEGGLVATVFIVVYMLFSPLGGLVGDRFNRKRMVAVGVGLWSVATVTSGLAQDYEQLLVSRALVGIGEAGYAAVAPAMIADLYRRERRGRMLAYFYLAIPLGYAFGYLLGGIVAGNHEAFLAIIGLGGVETEGWRVALCVAGAPGLLFAAIALSMVEPRRGASEENYVQSSTLLRSRPELEKLSLKALVSSARRLFRSPAWRINTGGMTLMTFTLGGIAWWLPTFFQRAHGMNVNEAGTYCGGVLVVAGLLGTFVGGHLGDRAFSKGPGGYFRVSGWGLVLGAPFVVATVLAQTSFLALLCVFVAEFFLFLNTGPLNAALVGCVPAYLRATAVAVNVLFIHALGDAVSPPLMGWISEVAGPLLVDADGVDGGAEGLALAIALTAVPLALGGVWLIRGAARIHGQTGGLLHEDGEARSSPSLFL